MPFTVTAGVICAARTLQGRNKVSRLLASFPGSTSALHLGRRRIASFATAKDHVVGAVPGLRLYRDFCTKEEEAELVDFLDNCKPAWQHEQFGVPTAYRSKHFGMVASLRPREVREPDPLLGEADLPADGILAAIGKRLRDPGKPWGKTLLRTFMPNEANVNEYCRAKGDKLHMHWDDRGAYDEKVCSLSLLGDATMSFALGGRSNFQTQQENSDGEEIQPVVRVHLPARSLMVLTGPSRFEWQHGFPDPADFACERRVALVFRRVRSAKKPKAKKAAPPSPSKEPAPTAVRRHSTLSPRREASMQSALIISTNWPDPNVSAAGLVTAGRIAALQQLLEKVSFASAARPGNAKGRLASASSVDCFRIKVNDEASVLRALEAAEPQLVVFDGYNAEERFGHYVHAARPQAMRVLDMQDFHALRTGREGLVEAGASAAEVAAYLPVATEQAVQRELASAHRCDAVLAISEEERDLLVDRCGLPAWKVVAAPFGHPTPPALSTLPGWEERAGAMFIGNWRHRPNRDCAQWLVRDVWPHVHQLAPDLELSIFGANQTPQDAALTDESINAHVRGYCRSVAGSMQRSRLLVAPLRFGAGLKGKVIDAMQNGLVVATTPVGVEGIVRADEAFPGIVVEKGAEDAAAFARAIVDAYEDRDSWISHSERAHGLASKRFDSTVLGSRLCEFLQKSWDELEVHRRLDFSGQMAWNSTLRSTEWMAKYLACKEALKQAEAAS